MAFDSKVSRAYVALQAGSAQGQQRGGTNPSDPFRQAKWKSRQEEDDQMEHIIGKLLQDYEHGKMTRRQLIRTLALTATAASTVGTAAAAAPANAIYINHVSMQVADYAKTRDFYSGLFGMKVTDDDGKTQCRLTFGDNILIARNASSRPGGKVGVDHIAYTLANWDADKTVKPTVEAELQHRGLKIRATEGSFHVQDPDGFEVQMGGKTQ
jgi:catechol 2,3-dioxygenase-like lactoylglutathione lyase family enzyme